MARSSLSRARKQATALRWMSKGLAFVLVAAVPLSAADYGSAATGQPSGGGAGPSNHKARPAPQQREGSADGQPHVVGENLNKTVPTSLKARYPDVQTAKAGTPPANVIKVLPSKSQTVKGFDSRTSKELPAKRNRYESTFANADGTETTTISTSPTNYQRPDGSWASAHTTLSRQQTITGADGWRSTGDSVASTLSAKAVAGQPIAELTLAGGQKVGWTVNGANGAAGTPVGDDTVRYSGFAPGADLELTTQPGGLKETVVLRSRSAARSYLFPLHLDGLTARLQGSAVALVDAQGNEKATIPAGFMVDRKAATSSGVTYSLVQDGGRQALKVDLDGRWLDDPARIYPIRVDPTVQEVRVDAGQAVTVRDSGSYLGTSDFMVGSQAGNRSAAYLKFNVDSLKFHTIYGAQLQVSSITAPSCSPRPVTVYPVTANWTPSTSLTYPGPTVGAALTSQSFAQGYIANGSTTTKCKPVPVGFNLGAAGAELVQRWVNDPNANRGISLRAPVNDGSAWKKFVGTGEANPPKLFVTHSPYNASYTVLGKPNPPVLQNQDGRIQVRVKNVSAFDWAPSQYYLKTIVTDLNKNQLYQYRGANLPTTLTRGSSVVLGALVKAMPAGATGAKQYRVYFSLTKVDGPDFSTEKVTPAEVVIEVRNLPPVVDQLSPDNGYRTQVLTPQLWGRAFDIDAPTSALTYSFEVCEKTSAGAYVGCFSSAYSAAGNYEIPAGKLSWNKEYAWRLMAKDANGGITVSPVAPARMALLTDVPQPAITSHLANAPYGGGDQPFDPNMGNHLTSAVDATIPVAGPELNVVRTYNSLDPRKTGVFGAGWSSRYDLRLVIEPAGSVLANYPDGQQVRFGKNPDGTYVGPANRQAQLTFDSTINTWTLKDGGANTYTFSVSGKLTQIKGRWGKPMLFDYGGDGKLTKVTSQQGNNQALTFTWNGTHVATVSTASVNGAPLKWTYSYSGDILTSVCAPDSKCTTYGSAPGSRYRSSILDSQPESYYRLNDDANPAASEVFTNFGKDNGTYKSVTNNAAGALTGSSDTAASFSGATAPSYVTLPNGTIRKNRNQSVEMWFKILAKGLTNPLLGYQNAAVEGTSTTGMPILYVGADGMLRGQFWNGAAAPMASANPVDEGNWHHVALTSSGAVQTLFVDGAQVGTITGRNVDHANMVSNQLGAAFAVAPGAWPGWGTKTRNYLTGAIDEVALYSRPLSADQVAAHYQLGKNAANQLTTVTLPSGKVTEDAAYDTSTERIKQFTDDNGGLWKISAPAVTGGAADLRRTVEVRDPADRRFFYEYDGIGGWMLRAGVPNGLGTREEDLPPAPAPTPTPSNCNTPDPGDPQFCVVTPGSGSQDPIFEWHALDGIAVRSYEYDKSGQLTKTTNEAGESTTLSYDSKGNNTSKTTCRISTDCQTSYTTYPTTGLTDPLDPRWSRPTESRDARASGPTDNTFRTVYTYVPQGDLATQTSTDDGWVRNTYTDGSEVGPTGVMPSGLVRTTTDQRGGVTTYSYQATGQVAAITAPTGLKTSFTYDAVGRKISQTQTSDAQPSGVTTTFTYDLASRLATTTGPVTTDKVTGDKHQQKVTLSYDDDGNMLAQESVDVLGGGDPRRTTFSFDDRNRLERQTDPAGNEVSYTYDAFGNKMSMTDANGNRYEYAYSASNQLTEVRLRDADSTGDDGYKVMRSIGYDPVGRMARETDTMGRTVQYVYYGDGLLKSKTLKDFHEADGNKHEFVLETDTYDDAGNLIKQITDNGKTTTAYTRDGAGRVKTSTVDPGGLDRTTTMTYEPGGKVQSTVETGDYSNTHWAVNGLQRKATYVYDTAGRQTSQTVWLDASRGLTTSWTYDQRALQTSITSPRGNESGAVKADFTTSYGYDELGRQDVITQPKVQIEEDGQPAFTAAPVTTVGYDAYSEVVSTKDALGNVGSTTYNKLGLPVETTGPTYTPPGGSELTPNAKMEYDANGNVLKTIDPRGAETRFGYDRQNRVALRDAPTSTNNDRAVWRYEYTGNGGLRKTTDPLGGVSESTYDDLDRVITSTQVERKPVTDNFTTKFTYDDADRLLSTMSPSGAISSTTYDTIGQPIKATDPSNVVSQFGYDFLGRQIESADGLGRTTLTGYDLANRVVQSTDLDASQTELRKSVYTVDADSNVLTAKPPVGGTVSYTYDALGQLVRQQEPTSSSQTITTSFGYDAAGNQTRYTDGRGNSTYTTVNSLGLTESVIEPSTVAHPAAADRTWTTSYDVAGNAVKLAEPGGVNRTRTFDAAGRLTNEAGSGAGVQAADRKAGYDALGRVTSINSIGADNTYTYNDRWQVLSATGPSGSASFSFDADGSLVQRADASGTANFGYTKGRLTSVTDSVTRTAQTFGYDNAGAPKTIDYGLGRARTFEYDELGRLKSDGLKNSAGTTVSSVAYTFDLSNNLTGKTTTGVQGAGANTYTYDDAGRLKSWTGGGKATTYGWDDAGNRVSADGKTARFDERNRLITDGTADYSYSARGTLLSKTTGSITDSTSFDAFDRVISQGGRSYQYDGADRPVTGNGTTMQYAGFSDEVVADGTQIYGHGLGDDVLSIGQGTTKRLTMSDSHSDVIGGFDPTDGVLAALPDSRTYDPFGKIAAAGGLNYGVGYQGDWNDPATGDSNMGARWYDPDTGTFTSRDTISYSDGDSATANKYLYGDANPLTNTDPTGNSSCKTTGGDTGGDDTGDGGTKSPTRNGGHDTDEGDRWKPPYVAGGHEPGEPDGWVDNDPYFEWPDSAPSGDGLGGWKGRGPRGLNDFRGLGAAGNRYVLNDCPDSDSDSGHGSGHHSKPKPPPPPDPAIKARKDLERDLKNNPQPNARGISDPLFTRGNPFGSSGNWNFVDDIRGQTAAIYQAAVAAKGVTVGVASATFSAWGTGLSAGQLGGTLIALGGAYSLSQIDQPPGFESINWPSLTGLVPQVGLLAEALNGGSDEPAQSPTAGAGAVGGGADPDCLRKDDPGNCFRATKPTGPPKQIHHYATNKSSKYTPEMKKIADRYGLDLDDLWNKESLPHQGRHPNKYHDFVLEGMRRAAREAGTDPTKFQDLFSRYVKDPVRQNPELLRRKGWN